jgi:hypothetical protein
MEILSAYISVRVTNTAVGSINPHLPLFVAWNQWPEINDLRKFQNIFKSQMGVVLYFLLLVC